MKFKIPLTFSDNEILKRRSDSFVKFTPRRTKNLDRHLKNANQNISGRQYMSIILRNFMLNLLISSVIFTSVLGVFSIDLFYFYGLGLAFLVSGFVFFVQLNYPKIYSLNKRRDIEKNLIPMLQDMLVQVNSGVPIFDAMINISNSGYDEVSEEFKKITREINSGTPQIDSMEKYGRLNTSDYFRRVLWQLSNGMRAGSDIAIVILEEIKNLTEEQAIQIQNYGSKLNPLIMFYMIMAVILPSLGITFLIVTSSMLNLSSDIVKLLFGAIFFMVVFIQIMFLGLIKSRRPTLL